MVKIRRKCVEQFSKKREFAEVCTNIKKIQKCERTVLVHLSFSNFLKASDDKTTDNLNYTALRNCKKVV